MGQVDYNFYQQNVQRSEEGAARGPRVGFFTLKQDKDQAIVRFLVDSPADLEIIAGHRVVTENGRRLVNCVRDLRDPVEACPLCARGDRLEYRVFIRMIEYVRGENNQIIPYARVWERPATFVNTITNMLNEYGPLSESIFKITRNGAYRSTSTTYDITYCRSEVYRPELYPAEMPVFKNYTALGNVVLNYSYEQLQGLVDAGVPAATLPGANAGSTNGSRGRVPAAPAAPAVPTAPAVPATAPVAPVSAPAAAATAAPTPEYGSTVGAYPAGAERRFSVPSTGAAPAAPRSGPTPGNYPQSNGGFEAPRRRSY